MDSFTFVIFGITSNLAQIKLLPAIYDMFESGNLPDGVSFVGVARSPKTPEELKNYLRETLNAENKHHAHPIKPEILEKMAATFSYVDGHLDEASFYQKLRERLEKCASKNRIFYLATYPDLYEAIFENLKSSGLGSQDKGWVRIMIEKPIGNDLPSSRKLNELLGRYFSEDQIYRLDHYLGKETIQNILTFRFANRIFHPIFNSEHIDHVQVTASEDFGIGRRGGYYDRVGALKDMGQNHLLQMIAFALMERPATFSNEDVTGQRIKVFENLVPEPQKVVFGQYAGYRQEENVESTSTTDTFFAFRTHLARGPFADVPIYVRSGKKLAQTATEVSIVFKVPDDRLFKEQPEAKVPNVLIYRIQPNEGIVFKILTKKPGPKVELEETYMQYCYRVDPSAHYLPDPYERLILDATSGDQTFFNDAAEVEAQWAFIDPLSRKRGQPAIYKEGSWGPKEADNLIEADGREWLVPSMEFCRI